MLFLASGGYPTIAHDRRTHGRSSQPSGGNEMDTYADDPAALIEALDLRHAVLVGHSTGGGEVSRYIGRHGTSRVAKAVLVSAVPPLMLKTDANPQGTPIRRSTTISEGLHSLAAAVGGGDSLNANDKNVPARCLDWWGSRSVSPLPRP